MEKLRNFMMGRYGMDKLGKVLLGLITILLIIQIFLPSAVTTVIISLLLVLTYFRCFSKDYYKRSEENKKFLQLWQPIEKDSRIQFRRIKEIRTHKYFRCKSCRQYIRVPRNKGNIEVSCPRCRHQFRTKS